MTGLSPKILLDGKDLFKEFKGALTEQYVCQQLKTLENLSIYYYTNDRGILRSRFCGRYRRENSACRGQSRSESESQEFENIL